MGLDRATRLARLLARPAWHARAACAGADPELFFPPRSALGSPQAVVAQAKAVCATCPVRVPCGEYAIAAREAEGVWGGMTVEDRQAEKRRREYQLWLRTTNR